MRRVVIQLSDEKIRDILCDYIQEVYEEACIPSEIRFIVSPGYSGEMGGKPTLATVEVIAEIQS